MLVGKVGDKVILEPLRKPSVVDSDRVWAEIDALRNGEDLFPEIDSDSVTAPPAARK